MEKEKTIFTFLDRYLDVTEAKVTYLTRVTPIDRLMAKTVLRLLPDSVTPNVVTKFRFLTIPFVALFLLSDFYLLGFVLFLFSAFSDAVDGALARTRKKITAWGTFYDPVADKLLIGTVATISISQYIGVYVALTIIVLEILLVASAYFRYKGRVVPAKTMGKTKMVLQCVGVIFLLLAVLLNSPMLLIVATYTLYLAIVFALLSLTIFRSI